MYGWRGGKAARTRHTHARTRYISSGAVREGAVMWESRQAGSGLFQNLGGPRRGSVDVRDRNWFFFFHWAALDAVLIRLILSSGMCVGRKERGRGGASWTWQASAGESAEYTSIPAYTQRRTESVFSMTGACEGASSSLCVEKWLWRRPWGGKRQIGRAGEGKYWRWCGEGGQMVRMTAATAVRMCV